MKRLAATLGVLLLAAPALAVDELAPAPPPIVVPQPAAVTSEIGRYQLFESQIAIGTVKGSEIAEKHLLKIIDNEQFQFSVTPTGTFQLAEFLHRVGALKNKPASWQDYFFADPRLGQGS